MALFFLLKWKWIKKFDIKSGEKILPLRLKV